MAPATAPDDVRQRARRRPNGAKPRPSDDGSSPAPTRTPDRHIAALPGVRLGWQILACAGLCAGGAALGLITVLHELAYHVASAARGQAYAAAALCAGMALGLWIPRRIIRRRTTPITPDADTPAAIHPARRGGLELEFAASLSGALIVAFALMWAVLCGVAVLMEDYRAFLIRRFVHPIWLTQVLLSLPAYVGLVLAGVTGTTVLLAVHGWYRLVTQPTTSISRLWTSVLAGSVVAGLLARVAGSPAALAWLAPLMLFVAGMVAVLRRSRAIGPAPPQPTESGLTTDVLASLLLAGLAAAVTATALFLVIWGAWITPQRLATSVVALGGGALAGLFAAGALMRLQLKANLAPLALLLSAMALLLPYHTFLAASLDVTLVRLALATGCSATCVVLVSRQVGQPHHGMQPALSWVGVAVAGGFGLTLAFSPTCAQRWSPAVLAIIATLVATATVGLVLIFDQRAKTVTRAVGLTSVMLWLLALPTAARPIAADLQARPGDSQAPAAGPLTDTARHLVSAAGFRTACLPLWPPSTENRAIWQFDLDRPTLDLVILGRVDHDGPGLAGDADLGRRLLRRISTRLAPGGRLVVELPTISFMAAALRRFDPVAADPAWAGYRLSLRDQTGWYDALVFGGDIPALIGRQHVAPEFQLALRPLRRISAKAP